MESPTDQQLLDRLRRGDRSALAAIYDRYKLGLFTYCMHLVKDQQKAEDVIHDTFLKLSNHAGSLESAGSFRAWLFRVARNEALMQLRRERRMEAIQPDSVWDDTTPLSSVEGTELQQIVREHVARLKPEYREVLVLREFEQISYAEIASITGDSIGSVKSRLFKARKALTACLAATFDGGKDL